MSQQNNDMGALTGRAGQLIEAIAGSIMSTVEVAAERIELAAQVAAVQQRMTAFASVLEVLAVQREAVETRLLTARGASKMLLQKQVEMFQAQELALLERIGCPAEAARQAVALPALEDRTAQPSHRREGKRFVRVETTPSTNGTNGHAEN